MTVFSFQGSRILTDTDGQITKVDTVTLDAITRIGSNALDVVYQGDPDNPLAVSLSDYNLKFDDVHLNDGDLPDQVEFFDMVDSAGGTVRVLNFVLQTDAGLEERMFAVGPEPLPNFKSPSDASLFFAQHEPEKVADIGGWSIQLDQIQNVELSGVFLSTPEDTSFEFLDLGSATDQDAWDLEFSEASMDHDPLEHTHADSAPAEAVDEWDDGVFDIGGVSPPMIDEG